MKHKLGLSIRTKLTLTFFAVALFPLLVLSRISFINAEKALKNSALAELSMSAEYKTEEIHLYLETLKTNTRDFSSDGFILNSLIDIANNNSVTQALNQHLRLKKLPTQSELQAIDILNIQGLIVASTDVARIGLNLSNRLYFQQGRKQSYVSEIRYNKDHQLIGAIAVPLKVNNNLTTIGVLINHYRMDRLTKLFSGEIALGRSSKYRKLSNSESIYLINANGYVLSSSSIKAKIAAEQKMNSSPVRQALQLNINSNGIWQNHLGTPVIGVSIIDEIDDFKFILLAEEELSKAFSQVTTLKSQTYLILVLTITAIFIISWLLAYFITQPLQKLISSIDSIAAGQFDVGINDIKNRDELGLLAVKFNNMAKRLTKMRKAFINQNEKLLELSIRDSMTGLYNHRHLIAQGEARINEVKRYGSTLSCMMIDIDHFKQINDTYGHPFGDFIIMTIADLLQKNLRNVDIIARYGGEEFAIIMLNTPLNIAEKLANKICEKIACHTFSKNNIDHHTTVSIGVVEYQNQEQQIMEILARADKALYQSKNNGRNQVSTHPNIKAIH
jgi:diguanylate cyclase (GGDEF)-like protein